MSFGYSIGDAVLLTQLAWKTVQNARKACGEHDELTREALSLQVVLRRLEQEVEKPENPMNDVTSGGTYKEELGSILKGCKRVLNVLDQVLTKYNALSEQERSGRKLWQKIRFGNGKMADLAEVRGKMIYYTSAISLFLNMVSFGTMGRVERQMNDAGGDLKEIKVAVNGITAYLMSGNRNEGSVLTAYADDDRAVWKEFRRELLGDGFSSSVIRKHRILIKAYIVELGSRGLFDEKDPNDDAEEQTCDVDAVVEGTVAHDPESQRHSEASLRRKADFDLPVRSKLPLEINTAPQAAVHLKTESMQREQPISKPASRTDPQQTDAKTDLRCVWLSRDGNGRNQRSPAEENKAPTFESRPSIANTDRIHDRSNDVGRSSRDESRSSSENDGSDNEVDESYYGSDLGLPKQRTGGSPKRNTEKPLQHSGQREIGDEFDDDAFARLEYVERQARNNREEKKETILFEYYKEYSSLESMLKERREYREKVKRIREAIREEETRRDGLENDPDTYLRALTLKHFEETSKLQNIEELIRMFGEPMRRIEEMRRFLRRIRSIIPGTKQ